MTGFLSSGSGPSFQYGSDFGRLMGGTYSLNSGQSDFERLLGLPHESRGGQAPPRTGRTRIPRSESTTRYSRYWVNPAQKAAYRRLARAARQTAWATGKRANPWARAASAARDIYDAWGGGPGWGDMQVIMPGMPYHLDGTGQIKFDYAKQWENAALPNGIGPAYADPQSHFPGTLFDYAPSSPVPYSYVLITVPPQQVRTNHVMVYTNPRYEPGDVWRYFPEIYFPPYDLGNPDYTPKPSATSAGAEPASGVQRKTAVVWNGNMEYRRLREPAVEEEPATRPGTGVRVPPHGPPIVDTPYGRPPPGVPERKIIMPGRVYRTFRRIADGLGEAYEWIDMLADAAGWTYQPEIGGSRVYNKAVWLFFYDGIDRVDWDRLMDLDRYNQVEDFAYGAFGQGLGGSARELGRPLGWQTGLAM